MIEFNIYFFSLFVITIFAIIFWVISLMVKDVSIVDTLWSLMFIVFSGVFFLSLDGGGPKSSLVLILVFMWGLRLSLYITIRNWGHGEDKRYKAIRKNNQPLFELKSLYLIFGFQAVIAWIISMPLLITISDKDSLDFVSLIGILFWLIGFSFEAISDLQLYKFKSNLKNKGKLLTRGLWKYTRHPNYFGNACIWWGFYILALSSGGWWSIYSPVLMTLLLLKFSGVPLLEKSMRKTNKEYDSYIASTNSFFPSFAKIIEDIKSR